MLISIKQQSKNVSWWCNMFISKNLKQIWNTLKLSVFPETWHWKEKRKLRCKGDLWGEGGECRHTVVTCQPSNEIMCLFRPIKWHEENNNKTGSHV